MMERLVIRLALLAWRLWTMNVLVSTFGLLMVLLFATNAPAETVRIEESDPAIQYEGIWSTNRFTRTGHLPQCC